MTLMKIAVFVEGMTETELAIRLLAALCGRNGIEFTVMIQRGGQLHYLEMRGNQGSSINVLLANCSNDGQVKTQIRDRYAGLVQAGYTRIVGLRDVYPFPREDLGKLVEKSGYGLPADGVPVDIHFAVMEVEAWFLDEISHFERVHPDLTVERIAAAGIDVQSTRGEEWDHPAEVLDRIYKVANLRYAKKGTQIRRTVDALSMEELYVTSRERSVSLAGFIDTLERALGQLT